MIQGHLTTSALAASFRCKLAARLAGPLDAALLEAADERVYREAINGRPRVLRKFEAKDLVFGRPEQVAPCKGSQPLGCALLP